jgi:large-conductance mechanosensitive channel
MNVYNSFFGGVIGFVILGFGMYFIINGIIKYQKHLKKLKQINKAIEPTH